MADFLLLAPGPLASHAADVVVSRSPQSQAEAWALLSRFVRETPGAPGLDPQASLWDVLSTAHSAIPGTKLHRAWQFLMVHNQHLKLVDHVIAFLEAAAQKQATPQLWGRILVSPFKDFLTTQIATDVAWAKNNNHNKELSMQQAGFLAIRVIDNLKASHFGADFRRAVDLPSNISLRSLSVADVTAQDVAVAATLTPGQWVQFCNLWYMQQHFAGSAQAVTVSATLETVTSF